MTMRSWIIGLATAAALTACDGGGSDADGSVSGVDSGPGGGSDGGAVSGTCGNGELEAGEECDDGNDVRFDGCEPGCVAWEEATGTPLAPAAPRAWEYFEIDGAICRDGSPAGIAVSLNPDSDGVMIYLEGGGACFNSQCESLTSDTVYREPSGGIFDRGNAANPVADWSMVYVPYCTGDVYAGDNPDATVPGLSGTQQFVGYRNMGVFMRRVVPTFREAGRVLLTGVSAGGFGAAANYQQVSEAFGPIPVQLLDDSGPPMGSEVVEPCLQRQWREVWNLDATVLADCGADCDDPDDWILDFALHLARRYPDRQAGLYSRTGDFVIRGFYGYGRNDCMPGFLPNVPQSEFQAGLLGFRSAAMADGDVFQTFFAEGTGHTCIGSDCFYDPQAGGATLAGWVGELLGGTATHVGP